jgi:hypothetical protein
VLNLPTNLTCTNELRLAQVPQIVLPIVSRLIDARTSVPADPQAAWHANTSQFANPAFVGIAAPAAADGPSPPQYAPPSFSNKGQVPIERSYFVPPLGTDASMRGKSNGSAAADSSMVKGGGDVQTRVAMAEEARTGEDGKCAIM